MWIYMLFPHQRGHRRGCAELDVISILDGLVQDAGFAVKSSKLPEIQWLN